MSAGDPMDMPEDRMTADEALAMDYALGALGRDERRAVEVRLRSDPPFRALVEAWQADLAPLDAQTAPQSPPPAVWAAIAAEIAPVNVAASAPARTGLWNSLALWRGLTFAGTAAAAIAIAQIGPAPVPVAPPARGVPPQLLVAALAGADGTPLLSAAYDPLRGAVVLTPATQRTDAGGKSPELWVIEGLKQDRIGVVTKVHHAAIDGSSGADLMVHLFDLEPAPADPPQLADRPAEHIPNDFELLGHAAASRMRKLIALPKLLGDTVGAVNRVAQGRRSGEDGKTGAAPLTAPRTSWNGSLSPMRSVGFARVTLDDVKALKDAFGCTVNDVVLGLCAGTLRSYMLANEDVPDTPLVAACPVSVRAGDDNAPGNKVSAMFATLDTQLEDPTDRIRAIQACTVGAKAEHNAVGADMLQNWAEYAAPNTFNLASRLYSSWGLADSHRPIHNVIISNVPGPNFELYYAGAEMVAAYPMGPVMEGVGLNITVMSYRGSVDFGFMVDRELVPDVWDMADRVKPALEELQAAAAQLTASTAAAKLAAPVPDAVDAVVPDDPPAHKAPMRSDLT